MSMYGSVWSVLKLIIFFPFPTHQFIYILNSSPGPEVPSSLTCPHRLFPPSDFFTKRQVT